MIKQVINYNGTFFNADDKILTASNRGFKYADGLFESMRLSKGKIKFANQHAQRLQAGMKALKIEGYSKIDAYFLQDKAEEISSHNKCTQNARLRLTVYRDGAGLYAPSQNKFAYVLESTALNTHLYQLNTKGLIMDIYADIPKAINQLSNYKTCNALLYVMAGIFKQQQKIDEAFVLNQNGFLCESISANLFLVYQNKIYTPALSEGCIGGVMRKVIIDLGINNGIEVIEAQLNPEILNQADEVFLTNASMGIQWVMGFNRKRYFNETSKFLVEKLNAIS
ncbi:MAG: 4-amino-4-deoxychorismate lyase [Sphingobacteriales bacterium]|nr:MAG: 4-amino-4-deoxychorismate lyase [Sphingobacteriales bacterium]TAF82558.1 MAG: 4-amino-4-deoxychorismate lyase [Sphingobacteriales bacterium]